KAAEAASSLRDEWVVEIQGMVKERPEKLVNPNLETGTVEVAASQLKILAKAKTPPFAVTDDGREVEEKLRLQYRYLDLRRPRLAHNLRLRHRVVQLIRNYLTERDFVEVETPILSKSTPEGARDFLVPSRLQPGKFYALPQSPQQYKQLLMIAGLEKYFQVARCFRDEDMRADRQLEFTQLDIEMSFVTQDEILNLIEDLYTGIVEQLTDKKILEKPFPRLTHREVTEKYGTDKPDLRGDKKDPNTLAFAFVVDWPLFEWSKQEKCWTPSHHPFTAPKDEDVSLLDKKAKWGEIRSWQHDLVCNGFEVAGGSLRIADPAIQEKVFEILGHSRKETREKFGHLLEAFEYGVPPHGGIAAGLDRFLALLCGEENIREVNAFPVSSSGQTAVMNAPSEVDPEQLKELGLKTVKR
ncbi:aspartate--tRNA ligase, partial [Candidatus Parcubacteria bacterium]|nr:aspartate--tRNA ligase [Candidatus Parcubacteria bacterium]